MFEHMIAEIISRVFAEATAEQQAGMFNRLGQELWDACERNGSKFNTQLCYIESKLDHNGRRLLKELGAFCD